MRTRVALYEKTGERLIICRQGSPMAFLILDFMPGSFAAAAAQLAAGNVGHWGGGQAWLERGGHLETIDRRKLPIDLWELPSDHWPDRTGQLVAMWEDDQVLLFGMSNHGGRAESHEPSWRARCYVGPSNPATERTC